MATFQVSKKNKNKNKNIKAISGWLLLAVSTFVFLFSVTKLIPFLQYFFLGILGIFVYPLSILGFIIALALLNNKKYVMPKKYAIFLGLSLLLFLSIIQLIIVGSPSKLTYGEFIGLNYSKQMTAGGMFIGFVPTSLAYLMGLPATYVVLAVAFITCLAFFIESVVSMKKTEKQNNPIKLQIKEKDRIQKPFNPRKVEREKEVEEEIVKEPEPAIEDDYMFAGNKKEEEKRELSAREKLGLVGGYKQQIGEAYRPDKLILPEEPEAKNKVPDNMSMREYLLSPPEVNLAEFNAQQSRLRSIAQASGRVRSQTQTSTTNSFTSQAHISAYQNSSLNQSGQVVYGNSQQPNAEYANASKNEINMNINSLKSDDCNLGNEEEQKIGNLPEIAPDEITHEAEDIIRSVVEQEKIERLAQEPEINEEKDSDYMNFDDIDDAIVQENQDAEIKEEILPEEDKKPDFSRENLSRDRNGFGERGFSRDNALSRDSNFTRDNTLSRDNSMPSRENLNAGRGEISSSEESSISKPARPMDEMERRKRFVTLEDDSSKKEEKIKPYKYSRPSFDLLTTQSDDLAMFGEEVPRKSVALENALENFGIPAKVQNVVIGPTVTRYEIEMPEGISVKRILSLDADIAYALSAKGQIRIEAPIPGRSIVGIEVPNSRVAKVSIKDVLQSKEFSLSPSPLTFALGKDITGNVKVCNLAKMPHLLVAGTTGSGKSVCINTIITSLIYKSSPDEVKFIMIDPKQVELSMYEGLPHMVVPKVITDPTKAVNALQWAVDEMERRFSLISEVRVRNIDEYNKLENVLQNKVRKIPYIVIIFDEFADFMAVAKNEIEDKIRRLAGKARAAGIHLILATQRPSTDVVTGTLKANLPARIAFKVAGRVDSEVIIGSPGAEKLLGYGDMLYKPADSAGVRIQGCLIETQETKDVVNYIIDNNEEIFDEEAFNAINNPGKGSNNGGNDSNNGVDPLLPQALKICIDNGVASTTMVQRKLSIGYPRAARIMDQMEERHYIASADGSKQRAVYISIDEFYTIFGDIYE